jgi:transposase-like protein
MISTALQCPFCGSTNVGKAGTSNGKKRYSCQNDKCMHKTLYAEYTYNACKPGVKAAIRKQAVNGVGVRAISRCIEVSTDTVISELKKRSGRK